MTAKEELRELRQQERRHNRDRLTLYRPPARVPVNRRFFTEAVGVRQAEGLEALETGSYEAIGTQQ